MAIIISIFSQKGGTGKTTVAINLYDAYKKKGAKNVVLVDADPQGSVLDLVNNLSKLKVKAVSANDVEELDALGDLVIVDCPPYIREEVKNKILPQSDMIIIPCRPSAADVMSLIDTIRIIEEDVKPKNPDLKAQILMTQMLPNNTYYNQIVKQIRGYGLKLFRTQIGNRIAYNRALMKGSIYDEGNAKAIAEIENLANEVYTAITL